MCGYSDADNVLTMIERLLGGSCFQCRIESDHCVEAAIRQTGDNNRALEGEDYFYANN